MYKNKKILIIDDEQDILDLLSYNLKKEGYQVSLASTSADGIDLAKKEHPDMIILDIMLPDTDGIETCNKLRENPQFEKTIIIFLTARGETYTEVASFEAGADDFIVKPLRPQAFISRIKSIFKRNSNLPEEMHVLKFDNLVVNEDQYLITIADRDVLLPKKAFEILLLLCKKPGRLFTREEIHEIIWSNGNKPTGRTIDVYISRIRESIGEKYITTVKGVGYKFTNPKY